MLHTCEIAADLEAWKFLATTSLEAVFFYCNLQYLWSVSDRVIVTPV